MAGLRQPPEPAGEALRFELTDKYIPQIVLRKKHLPLTDRG